MIKDSLILLLISIIIWQYLNNNNNNNVNNNKNESRYGFWFGSKHKRWRLLRKIIGNLGYKKVEYANDTNVLWLFIPPYATNHSKFKYFIPGKTLINHSPNDRKQFLKESLLLHLRSYTQKNKCNINKIHPPTYRLHIYNECLEFLKHDNIMMSYKYRWYTKVLDSFGGEGINRTSIVDLLYKYTPKYAHLYGVKKRNSASKAIICNELNQIINNNGGLLVQQALPNPLLLYGRKFDMRVYMLIANHDPYYVYYHRGFVRRSLLKHNPYSTDSRTFLTNTALQSKSKKYKLSSHRWWMDTELREYITRKLKFSPKKFWHIFDSEVKKLLMHVFLATKPHLERGNGYYLLLGVDVLVNTHMNLRVLEVNTAPRMTDDRKEVGGEYVRRQKAMLKEMLLLVREIHDKVNGINNKSYDPLYMRSANKWKLIYTDDTNGKEPYKYTKEKCFTQKKIKK